MSVQPYVPVSWSDDEPIFTDKLNTMTSNDQYLFEHAPTLFYNAHGIKKINGVKVMTGYVRISANARSGNAAQNFHFGNFFSVGCRPVVVATINSYPQGRFHLAVRGIDTFWPDNRGFQTRISTDELNTASNLIHNTVWVAFIAVGY